MTIRYLVDPDGRSTLAALLRVNKYVCSATLPLMYEDPFDLCQVEYLGRHADVSEDKNDRLVKLIQVIFRSFPHRHDISDLLHAAYLQGHTESKVPTCIPYYSFITSIKFKYQSLRPGEIFHNSFGASFTEYLQQHGSSSPYLLEEIPINLRSRREYSVIELAAARDLRRDLIWALCCANAERIKTLVLPVIDIRRYITLVPRLKGLSDLTILLDKGFRVSSRIPQRYTSEEQESLRQQDLKRIRAIDDVILMTREHCQLFPMVLKSSQFSNDPYASNDLWPDESQRRLFQILPPLLSPTVLNFENWPQFVVKAQETDLSLLRAIEPYKIMLRSRKLKYPNVNSPFMHRCRVLERIRMISFGNDEETFQWAVQERHQYDMDVAAKRPHPKQLVPLRLFDYTYRYPVFGHQLNNAVFAFGRTLECIYVSGDWWRLLTKQEKNLGFSVGDQDHGWDTPQLLELVILMNSIHIHFHPDILTRCPRLTRLFLRDPRGKYCLDKVVYWKPTRLPDLSSLSLEGTPATCFHPDILRSTAKLKTLELQMRTADRGSPYIPSRREINPAEGESETDDPEDSENHSDNDDSEDDGDDYTSDNDVMSNLPYIISSSENAIPRRRSVWTWDWDLPMLTKLTLNAEFGYRFQFKMLEGTPNLLYISIDICSWSGQHQRTITLEDLLKPGYVHPAMARFMEKERHRAIVNKQPLAYNRNNDDNNTTVDANKEELELDNTWKEFEYVHVPAVTRFTLTGPWIIDSRVLTILFSKVAPKISDLTLAAKGHTVKEYVKATSEYLHSLDSAYHHIPVKAKVLEDAGLAADRSHSIYSLVEPAQERTLPSPAHYRFNLIYDTRSSTRG
ncbi:hypothetical protein FBU30_008180 [Linnemannia zychae]|nr:hypothetical protein FBU30_008180 [Linnemannia zychae]